MADTSPQHLGVFFQLVATFEIGIQFHNANFKLMTTHNIKRVNINFVYFR